MVDFMDLRRTAILAPFEMYFAGSLSNEEPARILARSASSLAKRAAFFLSYLVIKATYLKS